MKDKRIAITGIGIVSTLGNSKEEYWDNRKKNVDKSIAVQGFDTSIYKATKAFEITDFNVKKFINRRYVKNLDRITRFCMASTGLALKDSGINIDPNRLGIIVGSKFHGIYSIFNMKETYYEGGVLGVSPLFFPGTVFNASGAQASIEWRAIALNGVINTGMASGLSAIVKSIEYLYLEKADAIVSGGNEMFHEFIFAFYDKLGLLSSNGDNEELCRPFDKERNGIMLGEGGCCFTIEPLDKVKDRNIYAEILGYSALYCGNENDKSKWIIKCMENALNVDGIDYTEKIDLIVSDGCGDSVIDTLQAEAIKTVFSNHHTLITSNKGNIGHTIGASGAFNLLDGILSIQNNEVAPIGNLKTPEISLNFVTEYKNTEIKYVLINSYDPNGTIVSLLIKRY